MRILYFELYCIPCHWAVVSVLSDCLFYDILLIFVSFLPFIVLPWIWLTTISIN